MKHLVIVESPTKAKTISKFLSRDYRVESSFGHVRDLPEKETGIDVEHDFKPKYVIPEKAKAHVAKLTELAKHADSIILATDDDREGEAISWHLLKLLKPKHHERIAFHEITKTAIEAALQHPRQLNLHKVDAQQARRVLDRLVGYELSPFLWAKVARGLSAGRVQSVAVRLVVERERERQAFKQEEYWTIEGLFHKDTVPENFPAKLAAIDGKSMDKFAITNETDAKNILDTLTSATYHVADIEAKEQKKQPPTPFTTSTLQQAANNKLNLSAKQTMRVAQQLYEGVKIGGEQVGLITYMRTDSFNLSPKFLDDAAAYIKETFGKEYAPAKPRVFKTKSKGAQEAHEAIRPTEVIRTPESIKEFLDADQFKVYNLIWSRSVATQMEPAIILASAISINDDSNKYTFRATGQTIKFPGFYKVYSTATETILPTVAVDDKILAESISPEQHFTQPPARYTEASLVKVLEEHGVGRPSTYAPTLATIQDRGYIAKEDKALVPTDMAFVVTDVLTEHFPNIVDYEFTAKMEHNFDKIEAGEEEWVPVIEAFYTPFHKNLVAKTKSVTKASIEEKTDEKCDKCGSDMIIKTGRFGRFMACTNYPECKNTKNMAPLATPAPNADGTPATTAEQSYGECPECKAPLVQRRGRFGPFIGCSTYPACTYIQKKQAISTGVTCPKCEKGEITGKSSKRGKIFFGCNTYPTCDFALWDKPNGEKCPTCKSLIVLKGKAEKPTCSNPDCPTVKKVLKKTKNKPKTEETTKI